MAVLLIACTPPGARSGGLADNLSTLLRVYSSGHQNDRNSLNSEHLDVLGNKADERQQMTAQRYRTQGSGPANRVAPQENGMVNPMGVLETLLYRLKQAQDVVTARAREQ